MAVSTRDDRPNEIVVMGAGLVGSLLAVMLHEKGFKVSVYERYSNMTQIPSGLKSINLIMTRRGLVAADELGVGEDLRNLGVKVLGRVMHQLDHSKVFQKYGSDNDVNYSVSRYELNCFLVRKLETLGVPIHWNHNVKKVEIGLSADKSNENANNENTSDNITLHFTINQSTEWTAVSLSMNTPVIGADGGPSGVRYSCRDAKFLEFTEDILPQGYKELIFPGAKEEYCSDTMAINANNKQNSNKNTQVNGNSLDHSKPNPDSNGTPTNNTTNIATSTTQDLGFAAPSQNDCKVIDNGFYCMEPSGLHIWPRSTHMLMGLADRGDGSGKRGTFTGTIYVDNDKWPKNEEEVVTFFEQHYPDAIPLLGGLESIQKQMLEKPAGLLGTVRTSKYNIEGRCLLLGDAAHAIVPFFGQGCNCGFEDVAVLSSILSDENILGLNAIKQNTLSFNEYKPVFELFHRKRKPSADAIADLALENFIEMRSSVGDDFFLKMKHVEKVLENEYPTLFRSRYAMVCYGSALYGNISYDNALKLTKVLNDIVSRIVRALEEKMGQDYVYKSSAEKCSEQTKLVLNVGKEMIDTNGDLGIRLKELEMDLGSMIGAR